MYEAKHTPGYVDYKYLIKSGKKCDYLNSGHKWFYCINSSELWIVTTKECSFSFRLKTLAHEVADRQQRMVTVCVEDRISVSWIVVGPCTLLQYTTFTCIFFPTKQPALFFLHSDLAGLKHSFKATLNAITIFCWLSVFLQSKMSIFGLLCASFQFTDCAIPSVVIHTSEIVKTASYTSIFIFWSNDIC